MKTRRKMTLARRAARGQQCTLRISGYGGCAGPETTVLAHAPQKGGGTAKRNHDWWAAFACSKCHDIIDRRYPPPWGNLVNKEMYEAWLRGIFETQLILRSMEIYCND